MTQIDYEKALDRMEEIESLMDEATDGLAIAALMAEYDRLDEEVRAHDDFTREDYEDQMADLAHSSGEERI
jgi:hypothetical protein